jgi:ABC-type Fe3+-hydroxamate transport system substrate-binding protein
MATKAAIKLSNSRIKENRNRNKKKKKKKKVSVFAGHDPRQSCGRPCATQICVWLV